jgi:putative nucleotidyltransferase with HDIG domain
LNSGEVPNLVIPLRNTSSERSDSNSTDNSSSLSGLALLWIATPQGTVSNAIKPALHAAAIQAGGWLAGAMRMERVGASYRNLGAVFANAIDAKDANRTGHSKAVSYYAATVARGMNLPEHEVERVEFAGLLHDIGKISVPDSILKKETPLTVDELEIIRHATVSGAEWLREVDGLQEIALMVRHQGERYDGGGYPDGLTGDAIPLGARILAVALRFSAMTKPRAHRRAMSVVGGALESLAQEAGASLDPRVVNAFLATMGRTL